MKVEIDKGKWNIKDATIFDLVELGIALKDNPYGPPISALVGVDIAKRPSGTVRPDGTIELGPAPGLDGINLADVGLTPEDTWDNKQMGRSFRQACRDMITEVKQVTVDGAIAYFKESYDFNASRDKVRKALSALRRDGEIEGTGLPGMPSGTYHKRGRMLAHLKSKQG